MNAPMGSLPPDFDPAWYLDTYTDVRDAGVDPGQHYLTYGRSEGRLPIRVRALEMDHILWRGFEDQAQKALQVLLRDGSPREQAVSGWVLARWWASLGNWGAAHRYILQFLRRPEGAEVVPHAGPFLLGIQACLKCEDRITAQALRRRLGLRALPGTDSLVGAAVPADLHMVDLLLARDTAKGLADRDADMSAILARIHPPFGGQPVTLAPGPGAAFDRLTGTRTSLPEVPGTRPLISVIVPVFNAARTLPTALSGLANQDWDALEILVVDDGSTDDSLGVAHRWAERDRRIRVLEQGHNQGAYPARNAGLAAARGDFITVHDSDDWSHPAKLRLQAEALMQTPEIQASVSHWVRCSADLDMTLWRMETGWVYRNVSSLMIRAGLRDSLGYWDRVRANADTEFYHRIQVVFGADAIQEVLPGVPLAFGRTDPQSLTMQGATHLRTQFAGVRRSYLDAALYWHKAALAAEHSLFLPQFPQQRPFRVPAEIGPADPPGPPSPVEQIAASERFDADWYRRTNSDVVMADIPAAQHYLEHGGLEDRDPGPPFSSGAYRLAYGLADTEVPLLHWEQTGRAEGRAPLPFLPGTGASDRPHVLVCAHMANSVLSGAERSFVDVLNRLSDLGFAPIAVVPAVHNRAYIKALGAICPRIEVLPQTWRRGHHAPCRETILEIREMIRRHRARAVYVNTVVLDAPLVAARAEGCESIVIVRELPAEDEALCRLLELNAPDLRQTLLTEADRFIANSEAVAQWLDQPHRTRIWPNTVPAELFDLPVTRQQVLRVGLISSNIAKKGLADFMEVARQVEAAGDPARFVLVGPPSADLDALRPWPDNVEHAGYAAGAVAAVQQVDLVMSLSHFAESFGRTVLEAMAAGRPVICYHRGTPPALVAGDPHRLGPSGGLVVPADMPAAAARAVLALSVARQGFFELSNAARRRARRLQREAERAHLADDVPV